MQTGPKRVPTLMPRSVPPGIASRGIDSRLCSVFGHVLSEARSPQRQRALYQHRSVGAHASPPRFGFDSSIMLTYLTILGLASSVVAKGAYIEWAGGGDNRYLSAASDYLYDGTTVGMWVSTSWP